MGLASLAQSREISIEHPPSVGLASLAQSREISIEHQCGLASLAQLRNGICKCLNHVMNEKKMNQQFLSVASYDNVLKELNKS